MSLRNGMWHAAWHNLCEIRYLRNDLKNKLTEERALFSRQFYKSASFLMLRTLAEYLKTTRLEIRDSQNLAKLGLGGQLIFILMICEVVTQ